MPLLPRLRAGPVWRRGPVEAGAVDLWSSCCLLLGELSEKKKGINIYTIKY